MSTKGAGVAAGRGGAKVLMRELRRANEQADAKAAATELRCEGAAGLASIPIAEEESCQPAALWIDRDDTGQRARGKKFL
jgi:hypothetical protein